MEQSVSGVGVIDKVASLIVAIEHDGATLNELVARTGLSRATAHRLASALETHGLLRRTSTGHFALGPRLITLGAAAAADWPLADAARPLLAALRDDTGESAQLYVRQGDTRVCLASLESPHGLRTIVAAGAILPLDRGSGGRALSGELSGGSSGGSSAGSSAGSSGGSSAGSSGGSSGEGWVASVAEREAGVASVSAPVIDRTGRIVAAVGVSGPIERLTTDPGSVFGPAVAQAAFKVATEAGLR